MLTPYKKSILEAFKAVSERTGEGASAAEVTEEMRKRGTISDADTVIDIADLMAELASEGHIGGRR